MTANQHIIETWQHAFIEGAHLEVLAEEADFDTAIDYLDEAHDLFELGRRCRHAIEADIPERENRPAPRRDELPGGWR